MSLVNAAKEALSITPTGQSSPVKKAESGSTNPTFNFTEGSSALQKFDIGPYTVGSCFRYPENKNLAAQRSGYGSLQTYVDPSSGDMLAVGNSENKLPHLKLELTEVTLPRMMAAKENNNSNIAIRNKYENNYSSDKGWVLTNSPQGMIAYNIINGKHGIIQEDGSLKLPA